MVRILLPVIALVGSTAWLLWPMPRSERWDIRPDDRLAAGKAAYLSEIATREGGRPNVVLIVADDLARHDLSFMGQSQIDTPNIDALAARSTIYPNAYATAAICAPSRAALLTGRIQNRFGFESQPMQRYVRNRGEYLGFRYLIDTDEMQPILLPSYPHPDQIQAQGLPTSEITLSEVLKARGYRTGVFGKWHLGYGTANHPSAFGFDVQYGFLEAFTLYADEGRNDIVEHRHPLFWEEHIWSMGRSGPSAITRNGQPAMEHRYLTDAILVETLSFIEAAVSAKTPFFAYVPFSAPHTPFQARRADYDAVAHITDHNRRVYAAMILRLDWAVGQLIAKLESLNLLDETIVIFTSDNGGAAYTGATANGPLRGGKFTQFEGGIGVPLLIRQPASTGDRDGRIVLLTDLFATVLDRLGLSLPADRAYDSLSVLEPEEEERLLLWRSDYNQAIRSGRWKLIRNERTGAAALYDLDADPSEQTDLAGRYPEVVRKLTKAFDEGADAYARPAWPRVMDYRFQDDLGSYWFAI